MTQSALEQLASNLGDHTATIAVIGLGYVGLPLAVEFAKKYSVLGFDINDDRIAKLNRGQDATREITTEELAAASNLTFTSDADQLRQCDVFIVTVPTPIDNARRPDLRALLGASQTIGQVLKAGDVVIYESTVYPGCTEEDCVPVLEAQSGLTYIQSSTPETETNGFFVGYSPERINPGDKEHRLPSIRKVTSGSTPEAAEFVDQLYASIITAGTHKVSSIRVAEAAKVIENTQRDVNIALVNELAMLFGQLGLDTSEVLEAAGTKWNFLPFKPGLVGGHCIGVDPYYLTHKAQQIDFHPQMILAGRRTNDGMAQYIASDVLKLMARKGVYRPGANVLVLGLAFKENCPDIRNTRVVDLIAGLADYNLDVDIHDPWVDPAEACDEYGLTLIQTPQPGAYDAVILAVAHQEFMGLGNPGIGKYCREPAVIYDVKGVLPRDVVHGRL